MSTTLYDVTCACGTVTTVQETVWRATRHDPADGETHPEECPKCGLSFVGREDTEKQKWEEIEPPERERGDWDIDDGREW